MAATALRCVGTSLLRTSLCAQHVSAAKLLPQLRSLSITTRCLAERIYSSKHEWVTLDGKIATVGISEYAQDKLGDIVYAQLPDEGSEFEVDDECGAVESVKAASEIYCPVSGTVTEKNTAVEDTPGLINKSPYDEGWLFKLEVKNEEELKELMDEKAYGEFLESDEA